MNDYRAILIDALSLKSEELERSALRPMKTAVNHFNGSFRTIYRLLIEKGILQDDPYREERTATDIRVPSSETFTENERGSVMGVRLSEYASQWDYLVGLFHLSLDNLSLKKVKDLLDLVDYVKWTDFSPHSSHYITRSVAILAEKVKLMNDPMAGKIVESEATQLERHSKELKATLKEITPFLRERYKLRVRNDVLAQMKLSASAVAQNANDVIDEVKFEFSQRVKGLSWFRDLVVEILEEDYSVDSEARRREALAKLKADTKQKPKSPAVREEDTGPFLKILDELASTGAIVASVMNKMNHNSQALRERKRSFGEIIRNALAGLFGKRDTGIVYVLPYKDAESGIVRTEELGFTEFAANTANKIQLYRALGNSGSTVYQRSRQSTAEQLTDFVDRQIRDLKGIYKRFVGLEAFFKGNTIPEDVVDKMKGCSMDLKNLKNRIGSALKEAGEQRERREEMLRLRKLGIEE